MTEFHNEYNIFSRTHIFQRLLEHSSLFALVHNCLRIMKAISTLPFFSAPHSPLENHQLSSSSPAESRTIFRFRFLTPFLLNLRLSSLIQFHPPLPLPVFLEAPGWREWRNIFRPIPLWPSTPLSSSFFVFHSPTSSSRVHTTTTLS